MGKASEIWKEIKPKIGEMLLVVNNIETQAEKAQEEAFKNGYDAACKDIDIKSKTNAAYRKGLEDAWECARKIYLDVNKGGLSANALTIIFGNRSTIQIFKELSASEAIEKIKAYEQKQEGQDGLRQNIQTIVDQCGYTLDEISEVLKKMKEVQGE